LFSRLFLLGQKKDRLCIARWQNKGGVRFEAWGGPRTLATVERKNRHCEKRRTTTRPPQLKERRRKQSSLDFQQLDCFAEPVVGPRFLADPLARYDGS